MLGWLLVLELSRVAALLEELYQRILLNFDLEQLHDTLLHSFADLIRLVTFLASVNKLVLDKLELLYLLLDHRQVLGEKASLLLQQGPIRVFP